jgi:cysteine dioxygenase
MVITSLETLFYLLENNIEKIASILASYKGVDWINIMSPIKKENYNENKYCKILINKNENFDMYLIIWLTNAKSPIHDHPNGGCVVKILSGNLIENIYQNVNDQAVFVSENQLKENQISIKYGKEYLHQITNPSIKAISLHVYFPPNYKQNIYKQIN